MPHLHKIESEKVRQELLSRQPKTCTGHASNTMRKKQKKLFSTERLNRVLEIDLNQRSVWVQPSVTMAELVAATLPYGLIPAVVPEFKGITVGGAINGAALESSSHRYGQFNDSCSELELLIGEDNIVWASEKQHSDLFYGVSGSYGTLGLLLSARLRLVPAATIALTYHQFQRPLEAVQFMTEKSRSQNPPPYLEAIVYGKNHSVVIEGNEAPHSKASPKKPWNPWFYQNAHQPPKQEFIDVVDYLFRHDQGAFWMGGYAVNLRMGLSYLVHKAAPNPRWDFSRQLMPSHCSPGFPGAIFAD